MPPKIAISILIVSLIFTGLNAEDKVNLLKNGSLNDGGGKYTPGWVFSFWLVKKGTPEAAASKWGIEKEQSDDKNKCLYLGTTKAIKAQMWFQQQIDCEPGQTYQLTFRAKGSASEQKWGKPDSGIYLMDEDNKWLSYQSLKNITFTPDWTTYSLTVKAPDNAMKLGVRLGLGGIGIFNVYFDDIKLIDVNQ